MTDGVVDLVPPEIKRDRWDRPLIMPPGGGDPVAYTRCTTVAGTIDDTYNLNQWQKRMVAVGLGMRPDLRMAVAGHGLPPVRQDDPDGYRRWCRDMDRVTEQAKEAAAASAPATIGTALHKITERMDRGQEVGPVPDTYLPHLAAYQEATAHLTMVHVERFLVHDEYKIGGTADRIVRIPGYDKLIIADTKTGQTQYGVGKMAAQLAIYAHSVIYDVTDGERIPIGNIDLDHGIIIALDAYSGKCELKWLDIRAGWEQAETCLAARRHRARERSLFIPEPPEVTDTATPTTVAEGTMMDPVDAALSEAIHAAPTEADLIKLWQAAGPRWKPHHTERATARKAALESLAVAS